ncbi:UNVERIFIED_CONTAM: hypothetical protein FKN15_011704 [Acipenser sinensis]
MVMDRPNPELPSTSADPPAPPPTVMMPESTSMSGTTCSPDVCSAGYMSPEDILPLSKTSATKAKQKQKVVKTRILTDTPEKLELEKTHREREEEKATQSTKKQCVKGSKKQSSKQTTVEEGSSDESDMSVVLDDITDDESLQESSDEDDLTLKGGDFVVVNFAGKSRNYHYIGLLEKVDGNDLEVEFLRRGRITPGLGQTTFKFRPMDEGSFPRRDVIKKLPRPLTVGGTARREKVNLPLQPGQVAC